MNLKGAGVQERNQWKSTIVLFLGFWILGLGNIEKQKPQIQNHDFNKQDFQFIFGKPTAAFG